VSRSTWVSSKSQSIFAYRTITFCGRSFQNLSTNGLVFDSPACPEPDLRIPLPLYYNASGLEHNTGLGCFPFARRYSGNRGCFLFLGLLRCFSSPRLLRSRYTFTRRCPDMTRDEFSHWGVAGSMVVCTSPTLIAAYHALLRLPVPRHPPYALSSLTESFLPETGGR
jgi:hypothetical protein